MDEQIPDARLSRLATLWTLVGQAHQGKTDTLQTARQRLLDYYGGAVRRYLLASLKDPDAADDLFQEFAVRILRGDLGGADPERGRFRNFVKGVLFHMIANYHKRERGKFRQMDPNLPEPAVQPATTLDSDREFLTSWRDELLARSWAGLAAVEQETGQPFHTVLRFRADHPDLPSPRLAEELSTQLQRPFTAAGVRQTLHRARDKFADLLLDAVAQSLTEPDPEQLQQELLDLGLLDYCRTALQRR
jgi:RNA polymerase sigma-70 factor (ECF subfamily)